MDFASLLQQQLGRQQPHAGAVSTGAVPASGVMQQFHQPAFAAPAAPAATVPPQLGAGVRLTGEPSLIVPALPTAQAATRLPPVAHNGCGCAAHGAHGVQGVAGSVTGAGGHTHVHHQHGPPALDRSGPPPELQAYGNGRIPPTALQPLGIGEHALWAPAARAFRDLMAHAAADGVSIGVTSSYRTYDKQVELADRLGLYSQGGLAARPGTSNHGWGLSIDLQLDDRAQEWMREHARDYGFVEDVPREPWHWTFMASSY